MDYWIYTDKDGRKQFGQGGVAPDGAKAPRKNSGLLLLPRRRRQLGLCLTTTLRQLRLWLLNEGLLSKVQPAIYTLPEPDKSAAQIEWEYATLYEQDSPFVVLLGAALGLMPEQIDDGFKEAAKL